MKKAFFFVGILILSYSSFSQDIKIVKLPPGARNESTAVIDGITTHNYSSSSKIRVNGVPFMYEQFNSGVLELFDGRKSDEVPLRYNIARDVFEVLKNNDTLTLNRPTDVKRIYLKDKIFIFDPELRKKADRKLNGYFELLIDGKFSLYIKRNKDLSFDNFAANYQGGSGTKEYYYVDKTSFVGKFPEGDAFLLNSSKSFINNLKDHKAEVKSFIKKENIKFKKAEDLVKLGEYYNKL